VGQNSSAVPDGPAGKSVDRLQNELAADHLQNQRLQATDLAAAIDGAILSTIDRLSPVKSSRSRYARRTSSAASLGIGAIDV
jgi:hypothetical protein